jgi:A/G-specific adenine glycosylase
MLQQTQVATAVPYYERFISASLTSRHSRQRTSTRCSACGPASATTRPQPASLRPARRRTPRRLPAEDIATLQTLPASAVRPRRHPRAGEVAAPPDPRRQRAPRARSYFAVAGDPSAWRRRLWALPRPAATGARGSTYAGDHGRWLRRMYRSRPACYACPLSQGCEARQAGRQHALPPPRRRPTRPHRTAFAMVAVNPSGAVLLEQRQANGLWGGLWSFPMFDTEADARSWAAMHLPTLGEPRPLPQQEHAFTHYNLTLHLICVRLQTAAQIESHRWFDSSQLAAVGVTKAVVQLPPTLMSITPRRSAKPASRPQARRPSLRRPRSQLT